MNEKHFTILQQTAAKISFQSKTDLLIGNRDQSPSLQPQFNL